ncbi:hypothetical protein [Flavobacterium cerinum]|uniref:Cytochrome c domain-containing protein n=1 Tax=Flavobacterium cerinum TaxID=2502784 RepID=A0A444HFU2_9FLAO|nr:hypothetical protein [Flavobacterium cerinum]RWX03764.1 hypothetical protein EPI11_02195 [Flavobacterium cerinum]
MGNKLLLLSMLALFVNCGPNGSSEGFSKNNMTFPKSLSAFKLFKGKMAHLVPNDSIEVLKLSSALFTDYTEKQRLLKLPPGTKMTAKDDGLPNFPEGTILAKTFYYTAAQTKDAQRIIETRILIKYKQKWNAATYQWNEEQTEALLANDGAAVPINIETPDGKSKDINYKIPNAIQCYDCHRSGSDMVPIGPKLRNLNVDVLINNQSVSQLGYLNRKGLLAIPSTTSISKLPDYKNTSLSLEKRARAYFEINCAHCHNPDGFAHSFNLNLMYQTSFENSGILFNKWNIEHRMTIRDMPKLGTTIVDKEGLLLIQHYLASLKKK